jgi:DNA-binding NarL/FixJ family response regulator
LNLPEAELPMVTATPVEVTKLDHCDILILEDEPLMSALLARYLQQLPREGLKGWKAEQFFRIKSLSSGFELLKADLSDIKIAIVDILLPQVTGVDLIRDFRNRFPNLGIIPISGMATEPMKRSLREVLPSEITLLKKPIRREEFLKAFHAAWDVHCSDAKPVLAPPVAPVTTTEFGQSDESAAEGSSWSVNVAKNTPVPVMRRKPGLKKAVGS